MGYSCYAQRRTAANEIIDIQPQKDIFTGTILIIRRRQNFVPDSLYNNLHKMVAYISILRGINVSGKKIIRMNLLKEMYEGLNFLNVVTYIQSGNVVFQFRETENTELEKIISSQVQKKFGFEAPVIVLKTDELKDIIEGNPYKNDKTKDIAFLHVTILSSEPEQINFETINRVKLPGEEFTIIGRAVYLYCPYGYGRTKLSNTFLEKKLKTRATTRNWKTTLELLKIAEVNQQNQ